MYSSKEVVNELSQSIISLGNNHHTDDVERKLIIAITRYNKKMEQCFDNLEHLIIVITECFPKFHDFNMAENRYSILVDSITKFQQSNKIDEMYRKGMLIGLKRRRNRLAHRFDDDFSLDELRALNKEIESKHSDLHILFPRYMVLYWYAFKMDREVLALYETYMRVFSPRDAGSLSEFLHIIENHKVLPSGFRHILSMVLGITSSQESCIYFVDEPEISLHIEWQRKLMKHLRYLLDEFRNNSILLVATHSPDVILNHLEDVVNFSSQLID